MSTLSARRATVWNASLGAAVLGICAGCASIVSGTKQSVSFGSTPPGAEVTVDGQPMGNTPVVLELRRKNEHQLRIALAGYQPYEIKLTRSLNGWYFGNIAFGGIIGLVVDAVNGAMYKLSPAQVEAALAQTSGPPFSERDGTLYIGVVMTPDPEWECIATFLLRSR